MRFWMPLLAAAVFALIPAGASRAAVTVFQDPTNTGTPGAGAVSVLVNGADVSLNLYYQTGTTASSTTPTDTRCLSGVGDEVCGWDIHISTTGANCTASPLACVELKSFTPDPGADVVFAISPDKQILRANGGVPTVGELGIHRIGTLVVRATAVGQVNVVGNLFVSAALAAVPVSSGNTLANASLTPDADGDTIADTADNCPTVANANQTDADGDLVGDLCDNCSAFSNVRVPGWTFASGGSSYLAANPWATLTGGQRDDDHDGFGNICDGDFTSTAAVTAADTALYKKAIGCAKASDTCGSTAAGICPGTQPCARYDLNSANSTESSAGGIAAPDTARYKLLIGQPVGPKCAACTGTGSASLPCEAGSAGGC